MQSKHYCYYYDLFDSGKWGPWGHFSECTLTCGGGKRTAQRICSERFHTGSENKAEDCNMKQCQGN